MRSLVEFLHQAYWWLSLIGGIHCAAFSIIIAVRNTHSKQVKHHIICLMFFILAVYFFTGLIHRENAPLPMHIMLAWITPIYFLLMPLLYQYCHQTLSTKKPLYHFGLHTIPAAIVAFSVVFYSLSHYNLSSFIISESMHHLSLLGVLLPEVLMLQVVIYSIYIFKLIHRCKQQTNVDAEPLGEITFRWLLILVSAAIINGFMRSFLVSLSLILGEPYLLLAETATRLSLLLTLYILAIYRLQQITIIAYQSGLNANQRKKEPVQSETVLDQDEKAFISRVVQGKDN
ncbi:MAG: hypothetical protein HAW66_00805 [Shewanella sp.]|nr:hypothetical protein [Shewanella sp.]